VAKPQLEIEKWVERLEKAIRYLNEQLVLRDSFGSDEAEQVERILDGDEDE
jgi:hypothetical protein